MGNKNSYNYITKEDYLADVKKTYDEKLPFAKFTREYYGKNGKYGTSKSDRLGGWNSILKRVRHTCKCKLQSN